MLIEVMKHPSYNMHGPEHHYIIPAIFLTAMKNSGIKITDNYWQGMVNVRFRYVNKPSFCMYSAVGVGVVMNIYYESNSTVTDQKDQQLFPTGQLTFLGVRAGRALGFFFEFGVGTNSIITGGLSYKLVEDL